MTHEATPNNRAPRILLVEPHEAGMNVIGTRLGEAGYQLSAFGNARDGFAELHRGRIDLVLAELRMPGMSGIELTRMMRDDAALRDIPIMLITGRSDSNGAIDAFGAGADDVIAKPFHFEVLLARIERRLTRARAFGELKEDNRRLDERVVTRAIEVGELRAALENSEARRTRLGFSAY